MALFPSIEVPIPFFFFFFKNLKLCNASIGTRKRSLQLGCMKRVDWLAMEEGRSGSEMFLELEFV